MKRVSLSDTRFIRRYHVLDVDEGVRTSMTFEYLKRFLDGIANVQFLLLTVVYAVTNVN